MKIEGSAGGAMGRLGRDILYKVNADQLGFQSPALVKARMTRDV
jgi:hypothetical protein